MANATGVIVRKTLLVTDVQARKEGQVNQLLVADHKPLLAANGQAFQTPDSRAGFVTLDKVTADTLITRIDARESDI